MSEYIYKKRPITSTQAGRVARATDTSKSLENSKALYQRPILIHSGPFVRFTAQQPEPIGWPWVTFDSDSEKNTLLDQCTFYPQHQTGELDISLRLILATAASSGNLGDDPFDVQTNISVNFQINILQYANGFTTPNIISTQTITERLIAFPATSNPKYPALSLINLGWVYYDNVSYNKYIQLWGDPYDYPEARPPQLYETDFKILQKVSFTVPFDDSYNADYPLIVEVRADNGGEIVWSDKIPTNNQYITAADPLEYIRMFNVASTIRERGVL